VIRSLVREELARLDPPVQRVARVHELVCAALAALKPGPRHNVDGARDALRAAAVELERLELQPVASPL
jgi:hypothetical protein